jgi:hypothetical protein
METLAITDLDFDRDIIPTARIAGGVGLTLGVGLSVRPTSVRADAFVKAEGNTTFTASLTRTLTIKNAYGSASGGAAAAAGGAASGGNVISGAISTVGSSLG